MRLDEVNDLESLVAVADQHPTTAEIWYSRRAVICVTDRDRFHAAHLILRPSPWVTALRNLERHKPSMALDELVLMVRTAFPNEFECGRGTEWYVHAFTTGNPVPPPYLRLFVPLWDNYDLRDIKQTVQCAYSVAGGLHHVVPNLGGMEEALAQGEKALRRKLDALLVFDRVRKNLPAIECPVFLGTPQIDGAASVPA